MFFMSVVLTIFIVIEVLCCCYRN